MKPSGQCRYYKPNQLPSFSMFQAALQVFRFEAAKSFTTGRCLVWLALCLFPSILLIGVQYQIREAKERRKIRRQAAQQIQIQFETRATQEAGPAEFDFEGEAFEIEPMDEARIVEANDEEVEEEEKTLPDEITTMICYMLVPQISCMLGLLLWTTPVIGSELEAQTWIYLGMRRFGRQGVVLGKYLVAVAWTASFGVISAVSVSALSGVDEPVKLAATLTATVILSSFGYAALYLAIGTVFFRRATVLAFVYSAVVEGVVSLVPATINQFTVAYRLRSIVAESLSISSEATDMIFGDEPIWLNVSCLVGYTVVLLGISLFVVSRREYPVQTEA